jgi:hypothetical protein
MNEWECEHPGCNERVVGCGSAAGLRAIGWYFELGPTILCPRHHPQGLERAEAVADHIQELRHFTLERY